MIAVPENQSLTTMCKWIRMNESLLHLDLSGVLRTASQVISVVKAVKKQRTILSLHLSGTQVIKEDKKL
jgi:hypothetical protein